MTGLAAEVRLTAQQTRMTGFIRMRSRKIAALSGVRVTVPFGKAI